MHDLIDQMAPILELAKQTHCGVSIVITRDKHGNISPDWKLTVGPAVAKKP
jgi:hypothetical protein